MLDQRSYTLLRALELFSRLGACNGSTFRVGQNGGHYASPIADSCRSICFCVSYRPARDLRARGKFAQAINNSARSPEWRVLTSWRPDL